MELDQNVLTAFECKPAQGERDVGCTSNVATNNFTESLAQSDRVSSWLWSVANNPNPSKLKAQDYKALQLTTHPTTLHPNVLRILS